MNKKIIGNILLIAFSLLFALGISEVVVRMLNLAPEIVYVEKWRVRLSENPIIGYEPIPNLNNQNLSVRYYGYRGASNSMGYRDYDHSLKKAPGTTRVTVIGDSVTAGLWINEDENVYTTIMEKQLNKQGVKADVMNLGVAGYNTRQEVETLRERGLQYKPDLVVVGYCLNDHSQDDGNILGLLLAEERKMTGEASLSRARVNPIIKNSALLRMVTYKVLPTFFTEKTVAPEKLGGAVDEFYSDTVAESLEKLAELSKKHNFDVLLTVFPDFGKKDQGLIAENYAFAEEHKTMAKLSDRLGFHYLDLLEPFRACQKQLPKGHTISYDRYHPNPAGSRCAGETIAAEIAKIIQ